MTDSPLHFKSIIELAGEFRSGSLSPLELTEHLLDRIEKYEGTLNAFCMVTRDRAIAEAKAAEAAFEGGRDLGPLQGVPYVAKDLYDVKGFPTKAGTDLLKGNKAPADSAAVRKLSEAGMVLLGKTNTVQFAYGGVGINHEHGTPHNPWHPTPHVPGGSSSGTAVAVASGMTPMGLGSDTGGSVRLPASLCGTAGLKTTVGRISRAGVFPLSWTLDSVGPLTRTVEDAAVVYQALQGPDPEDDSTMGIDPHNVLKGLKDGVKGMRIAFGETVFFDGIDAEVEKAVREAGKVFESLGAHVGSIEAPEARQALEEEKRALMIAAEAYVANKNWIDNHFDELDPIVAVRMRPGKDLPAADYIAIRAKWDRLRKQLLHTLRDVEALIVPTNVIPPLETAIVDADMDTYAGYNAKYLQNTSLGNILNLCAAAVPCGFTAKGLPIGLMIYAKPFQEDVALRAAYAFEQATQWHQKHPDLSWVK